MDSKRDTQKTETISHFVEKQTLRTRAFGENKMGERAYRRAERLVAAIYLLTNHIDPQENIRRIVRESAANILGDILSLRDEMRTIGSMKTQSIESSVRHLISLVRILAVAGFVSFENADVLTDALDDLGAFIETARRSVLSENIRLSRDDLMDVRDNPRESVKDVMDTNPVKDSNKDLRDVLYRKDILSTTEHSTTNNRMNRRKEGILEVLRTDAELGIKEIGVNLPEYSEKMIQRELAELIVLGHVKKLGFKRWSKYILAVSRETPHEPRESNTSNSPAHGIKAPEVPRPGLSSL